MPKRLPQRFQPDSIAEFQAAARERALDAIALQTSGRRTASIYLWGYVAEMTLKSAYFNILGFAEDRPITRRDLQDALHPQRGLHHLGLWAQALVGLRAGTPGLAYADPPFGSEVAARAQSLYSLWSETIRYHKNMAHLHEVALARGEAEWLLAHSLEL